MQPKLTRREKEIFTLLLEGSVPKEIAGRLKISYDTVVSHQKKLYRKLNVHSIEELLEKYRDKKDEILAPVNNKQQSLNRQFFKAKFLIPAGIAAVILLFILFAIRRTEDRAYFTEHTFDKVYLYANRWVNIEDLFYGEQCFTSHQILLSDIYSGSFNDLFGGSDLLRLKLSGTIDKECKSMAISLIYIYQNSWYYEYKGKWYSSFAYSGDKPVSIGAGDFSQIFTLRREFFDTLPEGGYFVFNLYNELFHINHDWVQDTGERLPEDMPNGKVWATISNLKVEPVL